MNREVIFSSATDEWATPQGFFDELNKEFHFTLDPAAKGYSQKNKTVSPVRGGDTRWFEFIYSKAEIRSRASEIRKRNKQRTVSERGCYLVR